MSLHHCFLFALSLALVACGPAETPADTEENPAQTVANTEPGDTLPYPIYASFEELAPLFQNSNDTTYVINFWATWCKPCVEELPYFEQLAAATANDKVKVVMVSLDFKKDVRTKLYRFIKDRPLSLPVVALTDSKYNNWIDRVDPNWGGAIPVTVVYRGEERRFIDRQLESYDELLAVVNDLKS